MRKSVQTYPARIAQRIFYIRVQKVMFDFDLAEMYGVETRVLKQAVRRNIDRFPKDFMFQLTKKEFHEVITNCDNLSQLKYAPALPMVFTEQGVSMLSSILKSKQALKVNIAIMRAFVQMRQLMDGNKELTKKIKELEKKYDGQFTLVFDAIRGLIHQKQLPRERIGFLKDKL
ncbi:MAG: ORF6N domain-containing protein [Bacteroidota bacterium]